MSGVDRNQYGKIDPIEEMKVGVGINVTDITIENTMNENQTNKNSSRESDTVKLNTIGWNSHFEQEYNKLRSEESLAGRIISEHRGAYGLICEQGELTAEISGKMRFRAEETGSFPAVGDWVVLHKIHGEKKAIIHEVLSRRSKFSRKTAGTTTREQIVAANVDYVFLVAALNRDFNLRRLERYLIVAWESGAVPVIVLSKADLCENLDEMMEAVKRIAIGVPVHAVSALTKAGLEELMHYLTNGKTVVLLGSSGVGKSTIINELSGQEMMETGDISDANNKGKHTTTHRQLIMLDHGGMILDTPGMRELQLWDGQEGISGTFEDIESLANDCRFGDCKHGKEPGCAIKEAIRSGKLESERYESYLKLQKELRFIEKKQKQMEQLASKKKGKSTATKESGRSTYQYE